MAFEWNYYMDIRPAWWANSSQADSYTASVRQQLLKIAKVDTGLILFKGLRFWGKWVVITHYDFSQGACNSTEDVRTGMARDGHAYGATVGFTPYMYAHGGSCAYAAPNDAAGAPHEILFHELSHAFRTVSNKDRGNAATTGGMKRYEFEEEFNAILLTNIFISDPSNKTGTGLRADHMDHAPLAGDFSTSLSFFESSMTAFGLVDQLCTENPVLCGEIAKVPAAFNPIAACLNNRAEAQKRSLGAKAVIRDAREWAQAIRDMLPF